MGFCKYFVENGKEKAELRPLSIKNYVLYNIGASQFLISIKDSLHFNNVILLLVG